MALDVFFCYRFRDEIKLCILLTTMSLQSDADCIYPTLSLSNIGLYSC